MTTDPTNCPLSQFEIRTVSPDAAYSGAFLTYSTSTGTINVDTNTVDSQNVYVRVTSGISGAYVQDTGSFTISVSCGGTYTITEGASVNPTTLAEGTNTGYILPSYTSSHASCPVITKVLSADGLVAGSVSNLNEPVANIVKPTDNSLHQSHTFYIKASTTSGDSYFGPYVVLIGCSITAEDYTASTGFTALNYWQNSNSGSLTFTDPLTYFITADDAINCVVNTCSMVTATSSTNCAPTSVSTPFTASESSGTVTLAITTTSVVP